MDARDCEVTVALRQSDEFAALVGFHGCYCLDIALGYRVAAALLREMGDEVRNLKHVVAYVGAPTCAIDAIQHVAGCTLGKRNLHYPGSGKSTIVMHNTVSGAAVRAYCHYWDNYDNESLRRCRTLASYASATAEHSLALHDMLDYEVEMILSLPEQSLFRLTRVSP